MSNVLVRYHIGKSGKPAICRAWSPASCPLGGEHFDSKDKAEFYLEGAEGMQAAAKAKASVKAPSVQVAQVKDGTELEIKDKAVGGKKTVMIDREWEVKDPSGKALGTVRYEMVTKERREKGMRYVLARWQEPGWRYRTADGNSGTATSKKAAVDRITEQAKRSA